MHHNTKPIWISHRGIRREGVQENSAQSFQAAVSAGFGVMETDLRMTVDGFVVLHHDDHHRMMPSKSIQSCTKAELLSLDNKLLLFEDFVRDFSGYHWVFDIKPETGAEVVNWLKQWVKEHAASSWLAANTWFLFWDKAQQASLLEFLPSARCFASEPECWRVGLSHLLLGGHLAQVEPEKVYAIPPRIGKFPTLNPKMVRRIQRAGGRVLAYLPNSEADIQRALDCGVDFILSDFSSPQMVTR